VGGGGQEKREEESETRPREHQLRWCVRCRLECRGRDGTCPAHAVGCRMGSQGTLQEAGERGWGLVTGTERGGEEGETDVGTELWGGGWRCILQ
jgi:hypothetical protein